MNKKKKIIIAAVSAAAAVAVAVSGIAIWKLSSDNQSGEKVFCKSRCRYKHSKYDLIRRGLLFRRNRIAEKP